MPHPIAEQGRVRQPRVELEQPPQPLPHYHVPLDALLGGILVGAFFVELMAEIDPARRYVSVRAIRRVRRQLRRVAAWADDR